MVGGQCGHGRWVTGRDRWVLLVVIGGCSCGHDRWVWQCGHEVGVMWSW